MIERILNEIPNKTQVNPSELEELKPLVEHMAQSCKEAGVKLSDDRQLVIAIHLLAFIRRVAQDEYLPELDVEMFNEVSPELVELSRRVLESYVEMKDRLLDHAEIFYLTVHFEAAKFSREG
jgi:PRD domain protein (TIGR03582 family)